MRAESLFLTALMSSEARGRAARTENQAEKTGIFGTILHATLLRDYNAGLVVIGIEIGLPEGAEGNR